jgi:hypothetical protein
MTAEEYKKELARLESDYESAKKNLHKEFALRNNPYSIGDVIVDHAGFGEIESIAFSRPVLGEFPQCVYLVKEMTAKKEYKKSGLKRQIWQSNIIKQ